MKNQSLLIVFFCLFTIGSLTAQKGMLSGTVAENGDPLIGVSISVDGTSMGSVTDIDGKYSISLDAGTYNITASYVGYAAQTKSITIASGENLTLDFAMSAGVLVDEVVVLGTRAANRTNTDSPVPVDVINMDKLSLAAPQSTVNSLLTYTAPSFSSNTQTISDGTDHIDPASLRGLGPDQVLVLVNQKRRHTSSLVNVNGTFGRGNVGTDLNAIPSTALKSIEVLRDGAAAQYGSDAIAGVINLRLKEDVNKLAFDVTTGANITSEIGPFNGETKDYDGEVFKLGVNYGLPIGNKGGFINLTGEYNRRGSTNRMQEFTGGIFNGYNSVERIALERGLDLANLSDADIKSISGELGGVFTASDIAAIQAMTSEELHTPTQTDDDDNIIFYNPLSNDVTEAELVARQLDRTDFNMQVGQSSLRGGNLFANMGIPLGEQMELYSFGGMSFRSGRSGCFYRLPSQSRTTTVIYPNGTVPKINSNITDKSLTAGIRGTVRDWNIDLSNTYGTNEFLYRMTDTHNATLGASSPTEFNIGGHAFTQNTANFDVSQYFEADGIKGINVAFGTEFRYENYEVKPGNEDSYGNYDINGNLVRSTTPDSIKTVDNLSRARPSGSQCFAGFLPQNQVDANRTSVAGYIDLEADISESFLLNLALRAEDYSDFGTTTNFKVATRYKVNNNIGLRGAVSTGFRAPSLHQIHFNKTSTIFELVGGVSVPQEVGTFSNTSRAAKLLGIPELKEETSVNFSVGFTAKIPDANLKLTVDAYQVNIEDRVILTGRFSAGEDEELQQIFEQAGATAAAFFSNAIDTESQGIDVVLAHSANLGEGMVLRSDLAATFSRTMWDQDAGIKSSPLLKEKGLESTYFDQTARIYLEQAVPRTKLTLSNTVELGKLSVYLRNTYFGETTEATGEAIFDEDLELLSGATIDPYNSGKLITDLSLGYKFTDNLSLTLGANNLFDIYPDEADGAFQSDGRFVYSRRSPQFSFGGRYVFARVLFTLE